MDRLTIQCHTASYKNMATEVLIFTMLYGLFAVCLVLPPKEFISSGLTIQHTFVSFLGSEELQFIQYHIRRTTITVIIISLLPLGKFTTTYTLIIPHELKVKARSLLTGNTGFLKLLSILILLGLVYIYCQGVHGT